MNRRQFVAMCAVFALASQLSENMRAASQDAKADVLSGTWKGDISMNDGERRRSITLDLKFDGTRNVTGTLTGLPNPGDVKSGTFDPDTGTLVLRLGQTGEETVRLVMEGTVKDGTASGRVSGDGEGTFTLKKQPA